MRPIRKIHGGKYRIWRWVVDHFPENYTDLIFLDLFGGGGSITLNKKPSVIEKINDKDPVTYSIYEAIKNKPDWLISELSKLTYSKETFASALRNEYPKAINAIVKTRMSRGGLGKVFGWSDRLRGGLPGDLNAWNTFIESIPKVHDRFKKVCIIHEDFKVVLAETIFEFAYIDPTYVPETRTAKNCYDYEMSYEDHEWLLDYVTSQDKKFLISGYNCDLYNDKLKGWNKVEKQVANNSGQGKTKQKRIEVLWFNY